MSEVTTNAINLLVTVDLDGVRLLRDRVTCILDQSAGSGFPRVHLMDRNGICQTPVGNMIGVVQRYEINDGHSVLRVGAGIDAYWRVSYQTRGRGLWITPYTDSDDAICGDPDHLLLEDMLSGRQLEHIRDLADVAVSRSDVRSMR